MSLGSWVKIRAQEDQLRWKRKAGRRREHMALPMG